MGRAKSKGQGRTGKRGGAKEPGIFGSAVAGAQRVWDDVREVVIRVMAYRPMLPVVAVFVLLALAVYGLERMKQHVYAQPEFHPELKLVLDDPPKWVVKEQWGPRVLNAVDLVERQEWSDADLTRAVARQLMDSGWVRDVRQVTKQVDGTVMIDCVFRRPVAMLHTSEGYVPVDREGYRLPEVYTTVGADSGWIRIMGVKSPVPGPNDCFDGEDARAGIRLASLVFDQGWAFASRISAVDVMNFRGRLDRREAHIKLWTPGGGCIYWGSAIGEEIEEPTAADKIANIAVILQRGGPHGEADVSVFPNAAIVPVSEHVETAERSRTRIQ